MPDLRLVRLGRGRRLPRPKVDRRDSDGGGCGNSVFCDALTGENLTGDLRGFVEPRRVGEATRASNKGDVGSAL